MEHSAPSMWILPAEHSRIFSDDGAGAEALEVGDEGELVEVTSKDLAKRCLELIGRERTSQ